MHILFFSGLYMNQTVKAIFWKSSMNILLIMRKKLNACVTFTTKALLNLLMS